MRVTLLAGAVGSVQGSMRSETGLGFGLGVTALPESVEPSLGWFESVEPTHRLIDTGRVLGHRPSHCSAQSGSGAAHSRHTVVHIGFLFF